MKKKNAAYVINGTRYGQGQFSVDLHVAPFVKIILKSIGLYIVSIIIFMLAIGVIGFLLGGAKSLFNLASNMETPSAIQEVMHIPVIIAMIGFAYLGFILLSVMVFSYSSARQRAYVYENATLDKNIAFYSTLSARSLAWVSTSNL